MIIIKRNLLLFCLNRENILVSDIYYMKQYILFIKKNITYQDSNGKFNYRIKFKFN